MTDEELGLREADCGCCCVVDKVGLEQLRQLNRALDGVSKRLDRLDQRMAARTRKPGR